MKKLMCAIAVLAMTVVFVPRAEASDSANLTVQVSFDQPLLIWADPPGPHTIGEGETFSMMVTAEDTDTLNVDLRATSLPEGAYFSLDGTLPAVSSLRRGNFVWVPALGQAQNDPYVAVFEAENTEGETVRLEVEITVTAAVISIEISPATWELLGVKLGELRTNEPPDDIVPIHSVRNNGTIPVTVDVGYGPSVAATDIPHPGLEQGVDSYITIVNGTVLDPQQKLALSRSIDPGIGRMLLLTFGAPTELSQPVVNMSVGYEFRAFADVN